MAAGAVAAGATRGRGGAASGRRARGSGARRCGTGPAERAGALATGTAGAELVVAVAGATRGCRGAEGRAGLERMTATIRRTRTSALTPANRASDQRRSRDEERRAAGALPLAGGRRRPRGAKTRVSSTLTLAAPIGDGFVERVAAAAAMSVSDATPANQESSGSGCMTTVGDAERLSEALTLLYRSRLGKPVNSRLASGRECGRRQEAAELRTNGRPAWGVVRRWVILRESGGGSPAGQARRGCTWSGWRARGGRECRSSPWAFTTGARGRSRRRARRCARRRGPRQCERGG